MFKTFLAAFSGTVVGYVVMHMYGMYLINLFTGIIWEYCI